ncbi:hypothetical protein D3C84_633410 [compost metagenome]
MDLLESVQAVGGVLDCLLALVVCVYDFQGGGGALQLSGRRSVLSEFVERGLRGGHAHRRGLLFQRLDLFVDGGGRFLRSLRPLVYLGVLTLQRFGVIVRDLRRLLALLLIGAIEQLVDARRGLGLDGIDIGVHLLDGFHCGGKVTGCHLHRRRRQTGEVGRLGLNRSTETDRDSGERLEHSAQAGVRIGRVVRIVGHVDHEPTDSVHRRQQVFSQIVCHAPADTIQDGQVVIELVSGGGGLLAHHQTKTLRLIGQLGDALLAGIEQRDQLRARLAEQVLCERGLVGPVLIALEFIGNFQHQLVGGFHIAVGVTDTQPQVSKCGRLLLATGRRLRNGLVEFGQRTG